MQPDSNAREQLLQRATGMCVARIESALEPRPVTCTGWNLGAFIPSYTLNGRRLLSFVGRCYPMLHVLVRVRHFLPLELPSRATGDSRGSHTTIFLQLFRYTFEMVRHHEQVQISLLHEAHRSDPSPPPPPHEGEEVSPRHGTERARDVEVLNLSLWII